MLLVSQLLGCASTAEDFSRVRAVESGVPSLSSTESIGYSQSRGLVEYPFQKVGHTAHWTHCFRQDSLYTFVLVNSDDLPWVGKAVCDDPKVQVFLRSGISAVAVNLPGYGRSTGERDMGGAQSQQALFSVFDALVEEGIMMEGIWATGFGAAAAAMSIRGRSEFQYLVLGDGVYDAEITMETTKNQDLQDLYQALEDKEIFVEERSVAWDTEGLPDLVRLYHVLGNSRIPHQQAVYFRDTLASDERDVDLVLLKTEANALPEVVHLRVLQDLLVQLQKQPVPAQ